MEEVAGDSTGPALPALCADRCSAPHGELYQSAEGSECTRISDQALRECTTPRSHPQEQPPASPRELAPEDIAAVGLIVAISQASVPSAAHDSPAPGMLPAPERSPAMLQLDVTGAAARSAPDAERPPPKPVSTFKFSRRNAPYVCQVGCGV